MGDSNDLSISHNASHAYYKTITGNHIFENGGGHQLRILSGGGGDLQYSGTPKLI